MMRWTYEFKVGLFSLGALLVIAYMFFVLSPDMFRNQEESSFFTVSEDASGIVTKTQVKTNGVVIGKVKSVQLDGNQSRIDFTVRSEIKIPRGSEVQIKEKGLLGDVFLEVIRAEDKGDYLKSGEFLAPAKDQVSISKLISVANSIGKDIKKITTSFADVIGGEEGRKNINTIVSDIRDVASNLKGILVENRTQIHNIVANFEKTAGSLKDITIGLREVLRPENRAKFDRILTAFDETTGNLKSIAKKVDTGEGTLGRLVNDDKMINEVQDAVKDIRSLLAPAKRMQVAVDFHAEYRGNARTQGYISVLLKPRPDKYYLIVSQTLWNHRKMFTRRRFLPIQEKQVRVPSQPNVITELLLNGTTYVSIFNTPNGGTLRSSVLVSSKQQAAWPETSSFLMTPSV